MIKNKPITDRARALARELAADARPWEQIVDELETELGEGAWGLETHREINRIALGG